MIDLAFIGDMHYTWLSLSYGTNSKITNHDLFVVFFALDFEL